MAKPGVLAHYGKFLPVTDKTPLITLGEGDTPLVRAPRLEKEFGAGELHFKLEACNPTGSFKDRGMVMAVAKALENSFKAVACASTGNTSASATAYAAAAGIESIIVIPKGKIALGKLAQAIVYGAKIVMVDGNFDDALRMVRELCDKQPVALVNSVNPTESKGRRQRLSRSATASAVLRICCSCRWATPVTSPLTGKGSRSTATTASPPRRLK